MSLTLLSSCQNNRKIDKKIVETEKPDDNRKFDETVKSTEDVITAETVEPIESENTKIEELDNEFELDTFFYSTIEFQNFGDEKRYDMIKLENNKLDIVGIFIEDLKFKKGDSIRRFYLKYFNPDMASNFSNVDTILISTDLRGDDTQVLIVKDGIISHMGSEF